MICRFFHKNIYLLPTVLVALFASCQSRNGKEPDTCCMKWDKTFSLDKSDETSPVCKIALAIDTLKGNSPAVTLINETMMQYALGNRQSSWEVAADTFCQRTALHYQEDLAPLYRIDREQGVNSLWYDYRYRIAAGFELGMKDCWCVKVNKRRYEGGVREIEEVHYLNFNQATGKQIFLEDLWTSGYQVALPDLLLQALYSQFDCENLDCLRDKGVLRLTDIYIPQNYKLGREGLVFVYNADEIAPYEMGLITLTIPYSHLDSFRKTDK